MNDVHICAKVISVRRGACIIDNNCKNARLHYTVIKNTVEIENAAVTLYGVAGRDGSGTVYVPDITSSADEISELLTLLSENDVELVHLRDVVEDYLAERFAL